MLRLALTCACILAAIPTSAALGAAPPSRDPAAAGAGTGGDDKVQTWSFACTPDAKSKAAGAARFVDTLDVAGGRAKSATLSADGFPEVAAEPKTVNDVVTLNVTFRKPGATAAYFLRAKPDGTLGGSLVRTEGGRPLRYTIGATSAREAAEPAEPPKDAARAAADASLDPAVLRVNGGFVRLMSAQAALADAGVKADKAKVAAILKAAGAHQNELRTALAKGEIQAADYVTQAEARLAEGHKSLAELLGDRAGTVDEAYGKPFAATYVYLNQMRAAVVEEGGAGEGVKRADQSVYQGLIDLATQAKQAGKLTPESAEKLKERTRAAVLAALPPDRHEPFGRTLDGMAAYKPGGTE